MTYMHRERINHLKGLLQGQGHSLYWLSKESGLSYQTVWRTMKGRTEPTFDTVERLYEACGYEIKFTRSTKVTKKGR